MKTKKIFLLATLLVGVSALTSCMPPSPVDLTECTSNCTDVMIAGRLYVKADLQPIVNAWVDVRFIRKTLMGHPDDQTMMASVKSDSSGIFRVNIKVDTTWFKDYSLYVSFNRNSIANEDVFLCGDTKDFSSFDKKNLENILFEFYYLDSLTINVQQTTTDSIEYLHISHGYENPNFGLNCYEHHYYQGKIPNDLSLQRKVAVDTYTKIRWGKKVFGKDKVEYEEAAIFCEKNHKNVYVINI